MKIRNLLILGMVLLGFTYCSSDEVLDGPTTGTETTGEGVKMVVSVKMPAGVTTRSTTGSDSGAGNTGAPGEEVGKANENNVNSILIAVYNSSEALVNAQLQKNIGGGGSVFATGEFQVPGLFAGQSYKVYAFVNPHAQLTVASLTGKTLEDAQKFLFQGADDLATAIGAVTKKESTQNNFFMSNADEVKDVTVLSTHIQGAPLNVVVNVERAVARIDYNSTTIVGELESDMYPIKDDVKVKITGYKLMNNSKSFFNLKRVNTDGKLPTVTTTTIGGVETATNYVVDTDWDLKGKPDASDNLWSGNFFNYMGDASTLSEYKALTATDVYALENTTPETKDSNGNVISRKGLATAVVFKGELNVPSKYTTAKDGHKYQPVAGSPVYVWQNKFYGTFDKLPAGIQEIVTDPEDPAAFNDTHIEKFNLQLAGAGVTGYSYDSTYKGYPVYYVYYNRHNNNGKDDVTGPMEFAVVRNNVYKLSITSINKFGHSNDPEGPVVNPDPNPEKPGDPIESKDLYMNVTAVVKPWTVRTNNIEF